MNVRKRGLALLMCICMIFTLLPFSALADATAKDGDIVYGTYGDDGKWWEDKNLNDTATYSLSGENALTLTKTATKTADNTYQIDLKVVMTQTMSTTPPGSAATVLVIDTSGSMADDNKLVDAKKAAISFLEKYKGDTANTHRYVSVVSFNDTASVTINWKDVSVPANYTAVVNAINGLRANGGTNLDQALFKANKQFSADTVKDIPASAKNVIALTDGCPTYYGDGTDQHGSYGCPETNDATEITATALKTVAGVYTVCFGAANEKCWTKDSAHRWIDYFFWIDVKEKHPTDGPKVGDFLKDSIATSASHAYNADNTTELMDAFKAITDTIVNGLNSGTVTDPMGDNVSLVGTAPSGFATNNNGRTYTWELSGAQGVTADGKTTYTYETSYTVKLDTSGDDEYHPLNGRTTFTADGKIYDFNVPGVYREAKYTVTYQPGDHGTLDGAGTDGNVVHSNLKNGDPTPDAPTVNAAEGYYFTGWDKEIAKTVTGNATYTAQYEKKNEITVVAKSDEVTYDGEEHSVSGFETLSFTIDGNTYTVSGLNASVSGTDANTYTNAVTGTAVVTDAAGNDVTGQFTVKTQDGTLTIKQAEVTITADNKEKFVDEADPEFTYTISGIVEADKDKKVTLTIIRDKVGTPEGELAGSYSIIPKDASIEGSNNYTFKYVNGTLTIKERNAITVTLTATKLLDGENATGSEFEFELYQIVEGKEVRIEKVKNNNAAINFTPIQFNKEGTYTYYMREVAGGDPYIKYDDTVYKIVITVDKGADGNYEVKSQTYTVVSESDEAVPLDKITFSNFTVGSLVVKKTVSGNAASTTKEFTFIVKLIPNSDTTNNNIIYGNVTNVTVIDNEISFKLKAGDSKTINGLPDGIRYTVQELDSNGYTVSAKVNDDPVQLENNMLEGTIAAGRETKVAFNNHKSHVYPPNPPIMDEIIVEITGNSDSVVYDGTEHSVKDYTVKISDPRYTEADFTFTGKAEASGVNAGTYEMGLKAEQFKNTNARFTNVKFVIKADGVLTITPKELTITAGSKTEYGPTPVTCDEWTVSGLAAGDKVESVKITGIQSVPGSSPNVPSDAVIKNAKGEDVTKNYAIKYVNGTLTMLEVLNKEDHFNYIIGTPEGLSLPTANVTRAEVATIFFRLMTDDARAKFDSLDNNFSDVAKGKWYNRAISTLAKAGIIKGDPAGTYRPGDPITRAEMAAIIARFGDFKEGGKTFNDISGHWAQKYIELAASNGWINGNPDGTFKPNNKITRAETVAMINRVLDRQTKDVSDLLPVSQMTNWSDNMDTAKWYYRDMQEATNNHKAERVGNSIYEKWTEKLPDIDWASYQI